MRKITHLHTADGWTSIDLLPELHPKKAVVSPKTSRRALQAAGSPPPSGTAPGLAVDVFLGAKALPLPQARVLRCVMQRGGVVRMQGRDFTVPVVGFCSAGAVCWA